MDSFGAILSFVLQFLPLFLIPFAFRLAGGAIAQIGGFLMGQGKKGASFIQGDDRDPHSLRSRTKRNLGYAATRHQQGIVDEGDKLGASRWARARGRVYSRLPGGPVDVRTSRHNAEAMKMRDEQSNTGRDDLLYAANGYKKVNAAGETEYFDGKNRQIGKNLYDRGKRLYGGNIPQLSQNLQYQLGKGLTDDDRVNFRTAFSELARDNNWSQQEAQDVWAAATYPHKATHPAEWYSMPTVNTDANGNTTGVTYNDVNNNTGNYGKMIDDIHKSRTSFENGRVRDAEWRAMAFHQDVTGKKIINGTASQAEVDNYAKTAEVLDQAVQQRFVTTGAEDGEVNVSGASAAASGVIKSAYENSHVKIRTTKAPDGTRSVNKRELYASEETVQRIQHEAGVVGAGTQSHTRENIYEANKDGTSRIVGRNVRLGEATVTGDLDRTGTPGSPGTPRTP